MGWRWVGETRQEAGSHKRKRERERELGSLSLRENIDLSIEFRRRPSSSPPPPPNTLHSTDSPSRPFFYPSFYFSPPFTSSRQIYHATIHTYMMYPLLFCYLFLSAFGLQLPRFFSSSNENWKYRWIAEWWLNFFTHFIMLLLFVLFSQIGYLHACVEHKCNQ